MSLSIKPSFLKLLALALVIVSVILLSASHGFERGVTIAIGLISIAGFASLFVQAYAPQHHPRSAFIALLLALFTFSGYAIGVGTA